MKDFNELVSELRSIADSLEESVHAKFTSITDRLDTLEYKVDNALEGTKDNFKSLESLQDDLEDLDGRIDEIESDTSQYETEIENLVSKVETLESDVSDIILIEGE